MRFRPALSFPALHKCLSWMDKPPLSGRLHVHYANTTQFRAQIMQCLRLHEHEHCILDDNTSQTMRKLRASASTSQWLVLLTFLLLIFSPARSILLNGLLDKTGSDPSRQVKPSTASERHIRRVETYGKLIGIGPAAFRYDADANADSPSSFCISQFKADFIDAMNHCRNIKMELVSIEFHDKEQALYTFLDKFGVKETDGIWTSGNDIVRERRFIWESSGLDFTYFNYEFLTHINWVVDMLNNCVSIQSSEKQENRVVRTEVLNEDTLLVRVRPNSQKASTSKGQHYYWKESNCFEPLYFVCQRVS